MSLTLNPPDQLTITDRKYCGYHDGFGLADDGHFVMRGKVKCWICTRCSDLRAGKVKAVSLGGQNDR